MIFYWLTKFWQKLLWLIRPPTATDVARIDPNAKCPSCGARDGKIRCVLVVSDTKESNTPKAIYVQHECSVDGARWYEKPVMEVGTQSVMPAKDAEFVRAA